MTVNSTYFRRLDCRCKLIAFFTTCMISLKIDLPGLLIFIGIHLLILQKLGMSFRWIVKEMKIFLVLVGMIFISRSIALPGQTIIDIGFISVTYEGIIDGFTICLRLILIFMTSVIFMSVTRFTEVKDSVEWFLKPIPFIPEKKVSVMISLLLRFFPLILRTVQETADAQKARGIENKSTTYRLIKLAISVLRKTFQTAENLACAMEARCYSEIRSEPVFTFGYAEYKFILILFTISTILIWIC